MKKGLFELLEEQLVKNANNKVLFVKRGLRYRVWTGKDVLQDVGKVEGWIERAKLIGGDKIIVWAPNMPEWVILFLACVKRGIIVVPADVRSRPETVDAYRRKTRAKIVVVGQWLAPFVDSWKTKICILEEVANGIVPIKKERKGKVEKTVAIVFTSGSSGTPKGVVITEKNIICQLKQAKDVLPPLKQFVTVSILPISHVYELVHGVLTNIYLGGQLYFMTRVNPLTIQKTLWKSRATYLLVVPQVLRLFLDGIENKVKAQGKIKDFKYMASIASWLPCSMRRLLFRKVHSSFGGRLKYIGCGSAALEPKLAKAWETMGFAIMEGYGASETTGMVTINSWKKRTFGTTGKQTSLARVKIGKGQEVLVKGDMVSPGYFNDQKKSKASFVSGWYKTGDIGYFDKDGNLVIGGRLGSRIVMQDGTKVYPEDVERQLNRHPLVRDSCVVGKNSSNKTVVYAFVLPVGKITHRNLEQIIEKTNTCLASKQQINAYEKWEGKDFPRLRSLKIDRRRLTLLANKNTSETEENPKEENMLFFSLENILKGLSGKKKIKDSDCLEKNLGLDSLRRIQMAAMVEENLGIELNELDLSAQTSVKELKVIGQGVQDSTGGLVSNDILDHWRFGKWTKVLRKCIQTGCVFPLFSQVVVERIVQGQELITHFPKQAIIIFNHVGMFDALLALKVLPRLSREKTVLPATHQIWSEGGKVTRGLVDLILGAYPFVQRGKGATTSLEVTGELADRGYSILFAPEGRMQKEGYLQDFKDGLGFLVKELDLPVVMVKISEKYREIFPPPPPGTDGVRATNYLWPRKRGVVEIKVGKATVDPTLAVRELSQNIRKQFIDL